MSNEAVASEMVYVIGEKEIGIPTHPDEATGFELTTEDWLFRCATGDEIRGAWEGIPAVELIDAAEMSDETTHLLIAGSDGYRMCLDVASAIRGLLALSREGSTDHDDLPRFVAPGVEGARTVQNVSVIESCVLGPDEDPEEYENLNLDEK